MKQFYKHNDKYYFGINTTTNNILYIEIFLYLILLIKMALSI
jgi:hypothetical protein